MPLTFPSSPSWRLPQRRIRAQLRVAVGRHPGRPGGRPSLYLLTVRCGLCVLGSKLVRPFCFIAFPHRPSFPAHTRNGCAASHTVPCGLSHAAPGWPFRTHGRYKSGYPPAGLFYSSRLLLQLGERRQHQPPA